VLGFLEGKGRGLWLGYKWASTHMSSEKAPIYALGFEMFGCSRVFLYNLICHSQGCSGLAQRKYS
jgi:hypothetical protein